MATREFNIALDITRSINDEIVSVKEFIDIPTTNTGLTYYVSEDVDDTLRGVYKWNGLIYAKTADLREDIALILSILGL